jgi:hypothetical protein
MTSKYQASQQLHAIRKQLLHMDQQFKEGFQRECMDSSCKESANSDSVSSGCFDITEEVRLLPWS